jgi:hypothetical protein
MDELLFISVSGMAAARTQASSAWIPSVFDPLQAVRASAMRQIKPIMEYFITRSPE